MYSYKNALVLNDYQVEDSDSNNNKSVIKVRLLGFTEIQFSTRSYH